jgi:hypothetical protein
MTWEELGLKPTRDNYRLEGPCWEGCVCGVHVLVCHTRVDLTRRPATWTRINQTTRVYAGHLPADEVANLVLVYTDQRLATVTEQYEKWRGIYAEVKEKLGE